MNGNFLFWMFPQRLESTTFAEYTKVVPLFLGLGHQDGFYAIKVL